MPPPIGNKVIVSLNLDVFVIWHLQLWPINYIDKANIRNIKLQISQKLKLMHSNDFKRGYIGLENTDLIYKVIRLKIPKKPFISHF